jgi:hypothetical protein
MIKKICLLVAFLVLGKMSYSQYPISQNLGSDSTLVISKGALQSRLINVTYTDTTAANLQRIRQYPGAQIATTTGGLNLWVRNANATAWIPVATGSGNNIYTIDGTLLGNRTLAGAGYSLTFNQLSKLLFNADSTTINTDQATISNNGVSTLSVKGATGRMFLVDTTAPADERIYELKSSNGEFFISILNDAQTSNDSAFLITSASRVGINTLNPDSTLKVGGGVNILGGLRVGNLPTSPGTKQLRINAQGQFSVTDTLIDAGGTVTSVATNNGSGITGGPITTTGTLAIDTTIISTKANVSGGLAGKLNISDTATMLQNYVNSAGYGLGKSGQTVYADSAALSNYYLRRKDSLTATNILGYVTKTVLADTAAAIRSADAGGTVTSVATNNGTGITGGTITTTGTLAIDTLLISTRAWRQKGVDSVAALANTKISGSLISGYLTKATGSLTIDTSQLYQSSGLIGIGTTSPTQKLQVSGNAFVNGQLFAGDTALSTYQVEGILSTPYVLGRKAVDNTLSTEARPTGIQGHVVGRGSIANRLQGGTFYATTDSASTANSTGSLRASNSWSAHNGSGTLANAWGSYNIVQNKTTGTITNAYGSVSGVENRGATSTINKLHGTTTEIWNNYGGTIDTAFGQVISIYNNNASSNIGAVYGLSIGKGLVTPTGGTHYWRNSGTIGTSYGIYLDTSIDVGATKYSIFSNSNSNSYFKGKLGVGTTSPDSAFQVATGALFQRGVRMSGLPTAPGTKALRINASGTISIADTLIDAGGTVTSVATNNGTGITGGTITTTGTLAIDTLLISTRAWRQKGIDSVQGNLTSGLALKVNISDTASMLSPYLRSNVAAATYVPQARTITINGTSQDLSANRTYNVGTVTSVATNTGTGITGGTFTTSGTIAADTLLLSTRAWRQKGVDSVAALISSNISGTTNYIPKFTSSSAIGNSVIYESGGDIGVGTTSLGGKFQVKIGTDINVAFNSTDGVARISSFNDAISASNPLIINGSDLRFNAGGSEQMRLTSTGLGIGTSTNTEAAKLNVQGGYIFLKETGGADVYFRSNFTGNAAAIQVASNNPLAFATNNIQRMLLDASGNLGVGTSSPVANTPLTLQAASGYTDILWLKSAGTNIDARVNMAPTGTGLAQLNNTNGTGIAFQISGSEQMRLTSTGLGIGTSSPNTNSKLTISDGTSISMYWKATNTNAATRDWAIITNNANFGDFAIRQGNSQGADATAGTDRLLISASGNLGLGVTPSAWGSGFKAFEVGQLGSGFFSVGATSLQVTNNYYYNGTNYIYANNGYATRYHLVSGEHQWYNAPSGTAGNAISFTQAMTLNANGELLIGSTSDAGNYKLQVTGQGYFTSTINTNDGFYSSLAGSNSVGSGAYLQLGSYAIQQLNASNGIDFWTLSGTWSQKMTITNSGNVGIGTTSPANKLTIKTGTNNNWDFYDDGTGVGVQSVNDANTAYRPMEFYASTYSLMNGNVGIGTTSPTQGKLVVSGSITNSIMNVAASINGGNNALNIGDDGTNAALGVANSGTDMVFLKRVAGVYSEAMRITSAGNVGIGTTSPSNLLSLKASVTAPVLDITRSGGGQGKNSGILFKDQSINEIGAIGTEGQTTNDLQILSTAGIRFNSSSDLISTNERMRITSGGNVGIGSTNPTRLLDVNGVIRTQNSGSAGAPSIELGTSAQGNGLFYPTTNTIAIATNDNERMRITSGGELLINTTSDAGDYKLQVNGNGLISGAITTAAPSGGTAKPWKLGEAGVAIGGSDGYAVKVEIDGTLYYLMTGYLPEPEPEAQAGPSMGYKTQFEQPVIKIKSDNQKIKDLEKEIAELKEMIKKLIK